ncbi:MAG: hypothetical protein J5614_08665 [Paludibacteraceae bacterium]|nr:hypothetical protein [Paludibacteraceae bacterium]
MNNIEEIKNAQSELMIQHAEVGCALLGKDLPAEAADWINNGVSIATKMNDATARQLMTIENTDKIIQNLSVMDSELLEGAVDMKKLSENSEKLKQSIRRNHVTWRIVLKAIAAALDLNIGTKTEVSVNDVEKVEETKDVPKLQQSFPQMLPEFGKKLSAIRDTDRQIIVPGFPLEQFKITKSGEIIDRTVDRAVKPTLRNGVPELFQARNASTGKIETVPIKEITLPEGYSVAVSHSETSEILKRVFDAANEVIAVESKSDKPDVGFMNDFKPPWVRIEMRGLNGVYMYNPETHMVVNGYSGLIVDRTMDGKSFRFPTKLIPCEEIFNKYPAPPKKAEEPETDNKSEWLPLNMDKLPEDRFIYNKNTKTVVDRRTGLKVGWRPYKDGTKYIFDVDGKCIYIRCADVEAMFDKPNPIAPKPDKPQESVKKIEPPKEDLKIPPRKIIIEAKPIDWLGPMIDTTRYKIYSDGSIEDTVEKKPIVPFEACKVRLQAINGDYGIWNLHELVWAAFHPEDRTKIRVTGSVFKINGHIDDNRLSNLIFKPSTTVPVTSTVNSPTQVNLKETDVVKEHKEHEDTEIDDGSRYIDWLPGVDPTKYTISRDGKVRNRHAHSKEVSSKLHAGKLCVKLQGKKGKNATYTVADLVNKAFPDQPEAIRSSGKFRLEDVTKPFDFNTYSNATNEEPVKETPVDDDGFVFIDWIPDIAATRYKINSDGVIKNAEINEPISIFKHTIADPTRVASLRMDNGGRRNFIVKHLVWRAFHPEDRHLTKIRLRQIDGDPENVSLDNIARTK